ncbi:MAG: nucleotidyltransferase family protein [Bacteroidales bacterium]|nr:nucleotidyltransferase family protein [Bacteroidales bacterium]
MTKSNQTWTTEELELWVPAILGLVIDKQVTSNLPPIPLDFIKSHRLLNLYYGSLSSQAVSVPEDIKMLISNNQKRMLKRMQTLKHIAKVFEENKIEYISLKGPVLSSMLYGRWDARGSRDIDVLIKRDRLKEALSLLKNLGFVQQHPINDLRLYMDKEVKLYHPKINLLLELHVRLFNNPAVWPNVDEEFEQRFLYDDGYQKWPVLPTDRYYVYLIAHAALHNFSRLIWLIDILKMRSSMCIEDYESAKQLAKSFGLFKWFDKVDGFDRNNWQSIYESTHFNGFKRIKYLWKFRSGLPYRWHELLRILLVPYRKLRDRNR